MSANKTPSLIAAFRQTMRKVEQTSGVKPDDPSLVELKRILARRVANLERAISKNRVGRPSDCSVSNRIRQVPENATSS